MSVHESAIDSEKLVNSAIMRHSKYLDKWCYEFGLILKSIEAIYKLTGNNRYFEIIREQADRFVDENGVIKGYCLDEYNLDHINPGKVLLFLYRETSLEKYKTAAQTLRKQLNGHPRNLQNGFWHKNIYPHQMWLDGLYMSSPFLAEYGILFDEPEALNDVANQIELLYKNARDPQTGLLYHAWDESKGMRWSDDLTGRSPHVWGRAMGWYVMAIADILDYLPWGYPSRNQIIDIFNNTIQAIIKFQDSNTGVWYQIVDKANAKGNYLESSASCMFTYAIYKGIRMNYIDVSLAKVAEKAYRGILDQFVNYDNKGFIDLGNVCSVAGLGGNPYRDGSLEYYFSEPVVSNDYKGYGPFVLTVAEYMLSKKA